MTKKITLAATAIFMVLIFIYDQSFTNSMQPPAGRTGCSIAPTETTCGASTCHNNTPNSGPGTISVTYSDTSLKYKLDSTYTMSVSTSETGKVKFGFEITVVDASGDSVGTFVIPVGTTNISAPTGGAVNHRKYLAHKNAGVNSTWTFQWKAPVTNRGTLTFFAASNCANGNGMSTGDHIYTTFLTVTPEVGTGVAAVSSSSSSVGIENISSGNLNVHYTLSNDARVRLSVFDLSGRRAQVLWNADEESGIHIRSFSLANDLNSGLYLLVYDCGSQQFVQKFFYQP